MTKIPKEKFAKLFDKMNSSLGQIIKDASPSYVNDHIPNALNFYLIGMAWRAPIF